MDVTQYAAPGANTRGHPPPLVAPASGMFVTAPAPESALVIATDTTLALAWRTEAVVSLIVAPLKNGARGMLLGIPPAVFDRLEPLRRDRDPEFARIAELTWASATWINGLGRWQRVRWAMSLDVH